MLSINPRPQLSEWKPAHETIVEMISVVSGERIAEVVAFYIKKTAIPKGHDKIIENWEAMLSLQGLSDRDFGVVESVLSQKKAAEEKAAAEQDKISESARTNAFLSAINAIDTCFQANRFVVIPTILAEARKIAEVQSVDELLAVLKNLLVKALRG